MSVLDVMRVALVAPKTRECFVKLTRASRAVASGSTSTFLRSHPPFPRNIHPCRDRRIGVLVYDYEPSFGCRQHSARAAYWGVLHSHIRAFRQTEGVPARICSILCWRHGQRCNSYVVRSAHRHPEDEHPCLSTSSSNTRYAAPHLCLMVSPLNEFSVYYRVFVLDHPFYTPFYASPDDTALGRFFPVDLTPPFTGQKVTNYLVRREHLNPLQPASLYANLTSADPVHSDELVVLLRGNEPIGDPNQPLVLVLSGGTATSDWMHAVQRYLARVLKAIAESPFTFFLCLVICFPGLMLRYWWALV